MDQSTDEMKRMGYPDTAGIGEGRDPLGQSDAELAETDRGERSPEKIQREIERTRADMDETVSAIQNRLHPGELVNQTLEITRNAVREGVPKMLEAIKHNPGPSLLIAAGIGWLVMNNRRHSRAEADWAVRPSDVAYPDIYYTSPTEYDLTGEGAIGEATTGIGSLGEDITGVSQTEQSAIGGKMHRIKEKVKDAASDLLEKAQHVKERAKDQASQMRTSTGERSSQLTERGRESIGHLGQATADTARRSNDRIWKMVQDNPLAIGAVAVAVGAAIGYLLPETETESRTMGQSREKVMARAREMGEETLDKAQAVAQEATAAAKDEARDQGLI